MAISFVNSSGQSLMAPAEFAELRTTSSLSFWIKTTMVGNDTTWMAPGVTGIEDSGGDNDIFWAFLDNNSGNSRICIQRGNSGAARSTSRVNDGVWHHVLITWDVSTGYANIYIDGARQVTNQYCGLGAVTNVWYYLSCVSNTLYSPIYLTAELEDIRVYNRVLTPNEALSIAAQRGGDDVAEGLIYRYTASEGYPGQSATGSGTVKDEMGTMDVTPTNTPVYSESIIGRRRAA